MDEEIRKLERLASTGDAESIERLFLTKDRANTSYPVYLVVEQRWEYNDNWMDPAGEQLTTVFRSRDKALDRVRACFKDFMTSRQLSLSQDLIDFFGEEFESYFSLSGDSLTKFLRNLGCDVERSEYSFWRCKVGSVIWTDEKIDVFLGHMHTPLFSIKEIVLS